MANAVKELGRVVLTSAQGAVEFTNIPATGFKDLRLVVNIGGTATTGFYTTINGDTGANYSTVWMYGVPSYSGNGLTGRSTSNYVDMYISGMETYIGLASTCEFFDYNSVDKQKTVFFRTVNGNYATVMGTTRWASTSTINRLTVTASSTTFLAGSTFTLFGVEA